MQEVRRSTGRARFARVIVGVLLAGVVAELALRLTHFGVYDLPTYDFAPMTKAGTPYWVFDPAHKHEETWDRDPYGRLPPGARMTYELNSYGLRGPEPDATRPKVLLMGDSFTFGLGVPFDQTFGARIERALATRVAHPPQIVNAGMPSYGTVEEAARLPKLTARIAPRAVVVVYNPNDPIPNPVSCSSPDLIQPDPDPPTLYLARLARGVLGRAASDRRVEEWYASFYFGERRDRWDVARRALFEMKKSSLASGANFGVVIFPLLHRLRDRPFAAIHEAVAAACREMGAPVLDLTDALSREPDQALWVHPVDHHPDARANELAAEAMVPFVSALLR